MHVSRPRLANEHHRQRHQLTQGNRNIDVWQWRHVDFTYESRFTPNHVGGRLWIRRLQGEGLIDDYIEGTVPWVSGPVLV